MEIKMNAVNQVPKGEIIFREGDAVTGIGLVVKGRVQVCNNGVKVLVSAGSFLGITDLANARYQVNYRAAEDCVVYGFEVAREDELEKIFGYNKDYASLMAISMNKFVSDLARGYQALARETAKLYSNLGSCYNDYLAIAKRSGYEVVRVEGLEELEEYQSGIEISEELLEYYEACAETGMEVRKAFYKNAVISLHHVKEQCVLAGQLIAECLERVFYLSDLLMCLFTDGEDCLFRGAMKLAGNISDAALRNETDRMIDDIIAYINDAENTIKKYSGMRVQINREYMENAYYKLISGEDVLEADLAMEGDAADAGDNMEEELANSLTRILEYSGIPVEKQQEFTGYMDAYYKLQDKQSSEDDARTLRRKITKEYYPIYLAVFKKAHKDEEKPRIVDLFLRYGYMDERLLTEEQLEELYHLRPDMTGQTPCNVYTMYDWLSAVYEGKKEPSKSEMDMDYAESLREKKKNKEVTEEQAKKLAEDVNAKLEYEINNMLTYNNRIISGQGMSFIPVLHEQSFIGSVRKTSLASADINAAVNRILQVDYAAFYRQSVYSDPENHITKEYIMVEVFPDIILLPTCGNNGIMWQDISGRKRTTPGRFLLPAFCDVSMEDLLIRMIGRFRWELCRTEQGVSWNDIKVKSLTSEYMDYLQFYKKNHDLSEEKKEKLKLQIQKSRGNSREVFVSDYFAWVKFESQGSVRLNKPVREILSTYCPFRKELREKVMTQPMFAESYNRFQRERVKTVRENTLRKRGLERAGVREFPQVLLDTYEFYEKM